jgi:hypothetical protein
MKLVVKIVKINGCQMIPTQFKIYSQTIYQAETSTFSSKLMTSEASILALSSAALHSYLALSYSIRKESSASYL